MLRNSTKGSVHLEHTFAIIAVALAGITGLGSLGGAFDNATAGNADGQVARGVVGSGAPVTVSAQAGWWTGLAEVAKDGVRTSRESGVLRRIANRVDRFSESTREILEAFDFDWSDELDDVADGHPVEVEAPEAMGGHPVEVEAPEATAGHGEKIAAHSSEDQWADTIASLEDALGVETVPLGEYVRRFPLEIAALPGTNAERVAMFPAAPTKASAFRKAAKAYWNFTTTPHRWVGTRLFGEDGFQRIGDALRRTFRPNDVDRLGKVDHFLDTNRASRAERQVAKIDHEWPRDVGSFKILGRHLDEGHLDAAQNMLPAFEVDRASPAVRVGYSRAEHGMLDEALSAVEGLPEKDQRGVREQVALQQAFAGRIDQALETANPENLGERALERTKKRVVRATVDGYLSRNQTTEAVVATWYYGDSLEKQSDLRRIIADAVAKNDVRGATLAAEELARARY